MIITFSRPQMLASVEWEQALWRFVFIHEISHLFGCQHDDQNAVKTSHHVVGYEFGYYVDYPENRRLGTITS